MGVACLFRLPVLAVAVLASTAPHIAFAQTAPDATISDATASQASPPADPTEAPETDGANKQPNVAPVTAALSSDADTTDWTYINGLGHKGWATPFPKMSDTVFRDMGGVRSALADVGIGFLGLSKNTVMYNVLDYDGPAKYNGKHPTYSTGIQTLFLTFDTGKIGVKDGQIFVTLAAITNGLKVVNGPRYARIGGLGYYQKLAGGAIEIKAGYYDNAQEYVGTAIAGSLASGTLGPQARIPVQLGFGYNGIGTPALNIRLNGKNGLYTKFGVQRAVPPGGAGSEIALNDTGLRFSVRGAKALYVDEVGVNQPATATAKSSWFRAGGIYNTTRYRNYRTGGTSENWGVYAAFDQQLTQPDSDAPAKGVYVGGSANYAPPAQNLYSQYYEGRVYGIGLIPGRPSDLASFVATYNSISRSARDVLQPGRDTEPYAITATGSYSYHFAPGFYVQPGLGIALKPAYYPKAPMALNAYLSIAMLL
jgi:porin